MKWHKMGAKFPN